jgi:hypothetical protein
MAMGPLRHWKAICKRLQERLQTYCIGARTPGQMTRATESPKGCPWSASHFSATTSSLGPDWEGSQQRAWNVASGRAFAGTSSVALSGLTSPVGFRMFFSKGATQCLRRKTSPVRSRKQ